MRYQRHRRLVLGIACAVLLATGGPAASGGTHDPSCVADCRSANCGAGDPTGASPSGLFERCTDACTNRFEAAAGTENCKVLAQCFAQCDRRRAKLAARCQRDRRKCIRRFCPRVPAAAAVAPTPAVPSLACVRACRNARAECRRNLEPVRTANRHCMEKCAEDCEGYPQFPRALRTCRRGCNQRFPPDADCQADFVACRAGCEEGATTTTTSTTTTSTTTTTTTVPS